MSDDIELIPPIPAGLREAAQRGILIPFVGAGASKSAGCPSWSEFANGALHSFVNQRKFSYSQLAQIDHLNPRVKLSLARAMEVEHGVGIDFRPLLQPSARSNSKGQRLYAALSRLARTFVTTNYGDWLNEEIAPAVLFAELSSK